MHRLFCKTKTEESQSKPHQKPLTFWPYKLLLDSIKGRSPKVRLSGIQNPESLVTSRHQSLHELSNPASEPSTANGSSLAAISFHERFCNLPRELRDLVYGYTLVSEQPIACWHVRNNYNTLEEVKTLRSILASNVSSQIAREACEVFFGKNTFMSVPWHLAEFLDLRSRLIPGEGALDVVAWVKKITITITLDDMDGLYRLNYMFCRLLDCPNLCEVIIEAHGRDHFRLQGRDGVGYTLCSIARVCKALKDKLGVGLTLRLRYEHRLSREWLEDYCSREDLTWLMEE